LLGLTFQDICPWPWVQIPGLILLVALGIFWWQYRKRQM